ncbi:MAG TPA: hypothetical protein ENH84_07295 [Phycisphaerae bacterium]|nr:hypothetical protein [Phycisphaerae bacterium]
MEGIVMRVAPIIPTLKSRPLFAAIVIVVLVLCWATGRTALALAPGSGSFQWTDQTGQSDPNKTLTIEYFRPDVVDADTPVWIIMHGMGRTADNYRDYFQSAAAAQNALVIAPTFSDADWPDSAGYAQGNISTTFSGGTPIAEVNWAFSKIEPLFDYVIDVVEPDIEATSYSMYGHSAGSQFVHRFNMWKPDARANIIVAANAGWYTMSQFNDGGYPYDYPYSLSNTPTPNPFPTNQLIDALGNRLVVLLGDQDNDPDPNPDNLHNSDAADATGLHRFDRGQFYFSHGKTEAAIRNVPFGWDMNFIRGVGHSGSKTAKAAASLFRFALNGPPPAMIDFPFDDPSGTILSAAADVADGANWSNNLLGVSVNGTGGLDVAFDNPFTISASVELKPGQVVDGNERSFARMIVDIAPWTFISDEADEAIVFGFGNTSAISATAQVWIKRVKLGPSQFKMQLRALAAGNEGSDSGWIEVFEGIQPNDQLRITLDLDKAENTFEVRYQLGDDPTYVFFDGIVDPDYIGKFLRLGFRGTFNDPNESFEILRYQVIPEPTSLVSILVFTLAGLGRRRRRR